MTDIVSLPPETGPSLDLRSKDMAVAGQWRLFWLKFKKHKVALVSLVVIVFMYLVAALADFIAPYDPNATNSRFTYAPPQALSLMLDGSFQPHVDQLKMTLNTESMRREFTSDPTKPLSVSFFVPAQPYYLLGFIPMQTKLFGLTNPKPGDSMYIFGADRLGRDIFSRVVHGAQVSLSIGLVGVFMSLILGVTIGGISGFFGGWIDLGIQRLIELLRSIPTIPLWMGFAAAIPVGLAAASHLFRHHADRIADRLDQPGAGSARQVPLAEKRGFRDRRPPRRHERDRHHLPPPGAVLHEPHHRDADACDPVDDPGRDRAVLPRNRPAAADHLLGRASAGGAEHPRRRPGAVAAFHAGCRHRHLGSFSQLPRRRSARCR